jgi:hypothetical protein
MPSPEDEAFRRLVILQGLFEESEEVHDLLNRIMDSPAFPRCQTPEEADRMLAESQERIRLQDTDEEPPIALAASTADQPPRPALAGVITRPDGGDLQITLEIIDHSPDLKLVKCVDFTRVAEELNTTDLGLFISGEFVAEFDPNDHCAEVPSDTVIRAEEGKAEVRVARKPLTDS